MTDTVVITRPRGDEAEMMEALHAQGYHVIHEPLTEIFLRHESRFLLEQVLFEEPDAVLLTSRHGAQALAALTWLRDMPLLCVGDATADYAQACGFNRVSAAGGTVERLINYVLSAYDAGSRFVYLSAEHTRSDLEAALAQEHMQMERVVVYEAVAAERLSDTLAEQLRRGQIDAITFLSQRSGEIFIDLAGKAGLLSALDGVEAYCLSEAIAAPLLIYPWRRIAVSADATLASLLESVDNGLRQKNSATDSQ